MNEGGARRRASYLEGQHVQRPWGRKELGVCGDLREPDWSCESGVGGLRRVDRGWWPAICCQPTMCPSDVMCSQSLSCTDIGVNGPASVFWNNQMHKRPDEMICVSVS